MANYWRCIFFSLAITFSNLLHHKIWQVIFTKLLEMLRRRKNWFHRSRSAGIISRLKTLLTDFLWEKNIVPAEKTSWIRRIISQMNRAIAAKECEIRKIPSKVHCIVKYHWKWVYVPWSSTLLLSMLTWHPSERAILFAIMLHNTDTYNLRTRPMNTHTQITLLNQYSLPGVEPRTCNATEALVTTRLKTLL
jgi:hypothetical protein